MLKEVLSLPIIKQIKDLDYEVSLFIYVDVNGNFLSFPNTEKVGDAEGVNIANIETIVSNCKKIKSNKTILVHNHPKIINKTGIEFIDFLLDCFKSSNVTPSKGDLLTTSKYFYDLKNQGITLIDHIIIGDNGFYSFKNNNLLE